MRKFGLILALMFVFSIGFSSAYISITGPEKIYNLGDKIYIDVNGVIGSESGNLNIDLVCGNQSIRLVKIPARSFSKDSEQTYSVPYKIINNEDLEIGNVESILGECYLTASLGGVQSSSNTFKISKQIYLAATLNKGSYNPGEEISLEISATKANGEPYTGFIEGENATSFLVEIINGSLVQNFSMDKNTPAGQYVLNLEVSSEGGNLNFGETSVSFGINQVVREVLLSLSSTEVSPGSSLEVGAEILDQSGIKMSRDANIKITSPSSEEKNYNLSAGKLSSIDFPVNAIPGNWNIFLDFEGITDSRNFKVLVVPKVEFGFEGSTLLIKNIGNGIYNKTITIRIGKEEIILDDLSLGLGEVKKYNLNAPEGEYPVFVDDGQSSIDRLVYLTGRSVSVKDFKTGKVFSDYWLIWLFLLLILIGATSIFFIRSSKTRVIRRESNFSNQIALLKSRLFGRTTGETVKERGKYTNSTELFNKSKEKRVVDLTTKNMGSAESALVLKGEKQISSIVCVGIKNYNELNNNSKNNLVDIIKKAASGKGLIDWKNEYVFLIFSPLATKTFNNEILASKAGFMIKSGLDEHNKKFNNKIKFNIGINSGDLVSGREKEKLKYTSIGNTISLAKKISNISEGKLLISDSIRKKLIRDLKVEKFREISGNQIYSVSEIKDREANSSKLKDILKRM